MKCKMKAEARVNPTEDLEKVIRTLETLFNYDELVIGENYIAVSGGMESLLKLKYSLEKRRIRTTARQILGRGIKGNVIFFKMSKQAAYAGIVNFVDEELSSLGDIEVEIETDNVSALIDWIAPEI